jgi:hypothetical protein
MQQQHQNQNNSTINILQPHSSGNNQLVLEGVLEEEEATRHQQLQQEQEQQQQEGETLLHQEPLPPPVLVVPHVVQLQQQEEQELLCEQVYTYEGPFDFEIVGLQKKTNGRSCCQHEFCGLHLRVREVVRLVRTIVDVEGGAEEAIKLVRIMDGADGCTIGFIPRVQGNLPKIQTAINTFAQVMEIYESSGNSYKQAKSKRNSGMACCVILNTIPQLE